MWVRYLDMKETNLSTNTSININVQGSEGGRPANSEAFDESYFYIHVLCGVINSFTPSLTKYSCPCNIGIPPSLFFITHYALFLPLSSHSQLLGLIYPIRPYPYTQNPMFRSNSHILSNRCPKRTHASPVLVQAYLSRHFPCRGPFFPTHLDIQEK